VIFGMLSATSNAAKSTQLPKTAKIYPKAKLWNATKNRDFSVSLNRVHVEEALEHVSIVWIFNSRIFHMLFLLSKKWPSYVNFSIPLCAKWRFFQVSISLVDMRFCWHVPNSPRTLLPLKVDMPCKNWTWHKIMMIAF
jgi:hypothetical protein